MAHDIFISYAEEDKVVADAVCAALEADKIRCWFPPRDIRSGEKKNEAIKNAIENCRIMILIFSASANRSKKILNELVMAATANKVIIPFKIDNILPSGAMEFYLTSTHWLDAMNPPTELQIENLAKTVDHFLKLELVSGGAGAISSAPTEVRVIDQKAFSNNIKRQKRSLGKTVLTVFVITLLTLGLVYGTLSMLGINLAKPVAEVVIYDGTYLIDSETGTIPLSSLSVGARVIDPTWEWEFRSGSNYSGAGNLSPVTWMVVAHDHYELDQPHVTLLSEELIGLYNYTRRTLLSNMGYSHWGDDDELSSVDSDLRSWLNSTGPYTGEGFYFAFSESFKQIVLDTPVPNRAWEEGDSYISADRVFIPSTTELGDITHEFTYRVGRTYSYFVSDGAYKRVARIVDRTNNYWTRSPLSTSDSYLQTVGKDGDFLNTIALSDSGVRVVINIGSDIMVSELPVDPEEAQE